jgi:hypothetical protein
LAIRSSPPRVTKRAAAVFIISRDIRIDYRTQFVLKFTARDTDKKASTFSPKVRQRAPLYSHSSA